MAFERESICACGKVDCEECPPIKASQIDDLVYLQGRNRNDCTRYMPVCRIGAQLEDGTAIKFIGVDNTGCLVKDLIHVRSPLVGSGTVADPLDIDFSLDSGIDECNFGSTLDQASPLRDIVGRDQNNCLRWDNARNVAIYTETPFVFNDSTSINGTTNPVNGHTFTASVILAPSQLGVANQTLALASGVYTPTGAGIIPTDTASVNHTFSTITGILTSDVKISAVGGNQVVIHPDGLFVPVAAGLQVLSTSCISLNIVSGVLQAAPIIAPAQNGIANGLSCGPNGLYSAAGTPLSAQNTATVTLTATGLDNHTLKADVNISTTANNAITSNATGIYAPTFCSVVTGMATGAVAVLGTSKFVGSDCQLHVIPANIVLTANDTATVNLTASGTDSHTLQADVKLSATANNSITANADGLYVPSFCSVLAGRPTGAAGVAGTTLFLGSDCQFHLLPAAATPFNLCTALAALPAGNAGQPAIVLTTKIVGADCKTYTIPDQDQIAMGSPNGTVEYATSGTYDHTINLDVRLSNIAGNLLSIQPDGLYSDETLWAGVGGVGIDITAGGTKGHTPTFTLDVTELTAAAACATPATVVGGDNLRYTVAGLHAQQPQVSAETTYQYKGNATAVAGTVINDAAQITLTNDQCYPRKAMVAIYGYMGQSIQDFEGMAHAQGTWEWDAGNPGVYSAIIILNGLLNWTPTATYPHTNNGGPSVNQADSKVAYITIPANSTVTIKGRYTATTLNRDNKAHNILLEGIIRMFGHLI